MSDRSSSSALPSESELMGQYQVSRNTVRRALGDGGFMIILDVDYVLAAEDVAVLGAATEAAISTY